MAYDSPRYDAGVGVAENPRSAAWHPPQQRFHGPSLRGTSSSGGGGDERVRGRSGGGGDERVVGIGIKAMR